MKNRSVDKARRAYGWAAGLLVVVVAAAAPIAMDDYLRHVAVLVLLYAVLALSWDILARTGQLSLAHAAFFGVGSYVAALTWKNWGVPDVISIILAGMVAVALAVGLGFITLRMRGIYFAIATLAFGEVLKTAALQLRDFTGGAIGISLNPIFDGERLPAYFFSLLLLLVVSAISVGMRNSRWHYALTAIRTNEDTARVMGINVVFYKVAAFAVSAFFAGVVGGFYAHYTTYIIPYEAFNLNVSVASLVMPILGGLYSTAGPILGAVILKSVEEYLRITITYGYMIAYGLILALVVMFMPHGLVGVFRDVASRSRKGDQALRRAVGGQ